jgi:hypothetical protein
LKGTQADRSGTKPFALLGRRAHLLDATAQSLVDDFFLAGLAAAPQALNGGSDIVVDRQGRAHTS